MDYYIAAGGVVVNKGKVCISAEKKHSSIWLIPKGRTEGSETIFDTAKREILEETGISDLQLIKKLGIIKRENFMRTAIVEIHIFLFRTYQEKLRPDEENIAGWCTIEKAIEKLYFKEEKEFLLKHKEGILNA